MKRLTAFLMVCLSLLIACSKDNFKTFDINEYSSLDDLQASFAKILSEAVSENMSLRSFIRETALKEFDCDYDVFYPFIKDEEVEEGKTFRDILLKYCGENELSVIEQNIPKLNIMVPDWSWIGCFSVKDWDTANDRVAVSYKSVEGYIEVFENGKSLGNLPSGSFPDFPVLIVKSNERMNYIPSTKGSDGQYEFIDESFNNVKTKVTHTYTYPIIDGTPDVSNFVPESQINNRVKTAYSYFPEGERSIYQRDFLYYNMTDDNQEKPLYTNVWETLYKFKFDKFNVSGLFDDKIGTEIYDIDQSNLNKSLNYKKNGSPKTASELKSFFYAEGNLELVFQICIPTNGGGTFSTQKTKSVSFSDIFAIAHANLDYRHKTLFCRDWYVYTIDIDAIKPKWCVLNWRLPRWDVSQNSSIITVNVIEFDETGSNEFTYSTKRSIAFNFKEDCSVEIGTAPMWKIGLGLEQSITSENGTTEKFTRSQGGLDHLGQAELEYVSPVLIRKATKDGVSGYDVFTTSTGDVDLMFLPTSF